MDLTLTPLRRRQILIFIVGWLAYASTYCLRKPIGVIKSDLEVLMGLSKTQLGWLDTALLLPYALMQMLLGPLGDKFGPRRTFGACLLLAALSMVSFGSWSNFYMFCVLLFLNGTAQAQCWPNCMKTIGAWYPDNIRNSLFGGFGTCTFAGGIMGTALAVYLQRWYGWQSTFFTPSLIVGVMGFVVLLCFQLPDELNMEIPGKAQQTSSSSTTKSDTSWLKLWKIPMVVEVALSVFCLKAVRYCMYMWLPMYLFHKLQYSKAQAGMFSTAFEIGGVMGSAGIGLILDRYFKGKPLWGTTLSGILSGVFLLLFMFTGTWGVFYNMLFLSLAGAFNCGPDSILGGSVPAELGEMDGKNAGAATVGLVNGFGSVGTFLEGPIIGWIATAYGWSGIFYFMIALTFIGSAANFRASVIKTRLPRSIPDSIPLMNEEA